MVYSLLMIEIEQTAVFSEWVERLRDSRARVKIVARIKRLSFGNFGDAAPVGAGVSELRIHYGPGYRVYLVKTGERLIVLLCGGDKSTQEKDIKLAKKMAKELED